MRNINVGLALKADVGRAVCVKIHELTIPDSTRQITNGLLDSSEAMASFETCRIWWQQGVCCSLATSVSFFCSVSLRCFCDRGPDHLLQFDLRAAQAARDGMHNTIMVDRPVSPPLIWESRVQRRVSRVLMPT